MKSATATEEMRAHPRLALKARGVIHLADGESVSGLFVDISAGGARLEASSLQSDLSIGKRVALDIPVVAEQGHGRVRRLTGTVVGTEKTGQGKTLLRFQFAADSAARLKPVLASLRPEPS